MRPRVIPLHPKTKQKLRRLRREAEADGADRVAQRIHAILLNSEEHTSGQIAHLLEAPLSRVSQWLRDDEALGYEALREGYRSGRPARLSQAEQEALGAIIDSGPIADGFLTGVWTSPMMARVIAEEFDIQYHPGHVRKLLHQLGFSVQQPRRVLARADRQAEDRWHRDIYPAIKKKPRPGERP